MNLLGALAVGCTEDLVDVRRGTITSVRWIVVVPIDGTAVEDGDVAIAISGKPECRAETESSSADDDDLLAVGGHDEVG